MFSKEEGDLNKCTPCPPPAFAQKPAPHQLRGGETSHDTSRIECQMFPRSPPQKNCYLRIFSRSIIPVSPSSNPASGTHVLRTGLSQQTSPLITFSPGSWDPWQPYDMETLSMDISLHSASDHFLSFTLPPSLTCCYL